MAKYNIDDILSELGVDEKADAGPRAGAKAPARRHRIDEAEAWMRGLGFSELRVRHHGADDDAMARLEVPLADLARVAAPGVREEVARGLRAIGFRYVVLDLEGFRSGRLNEALRRLPHVNETQPAKQAAPLQ